MKYCHILLTAIISSTTTASLSAQTEFNPRGPWYLENGDTHSWNFEAFLGIEYEPAFAASDSYESEATLDLRAIYLDGRGNRYRINLGEIAATFDLGKNWALQAKLEYEEGRDAEDVAILQSFEEVRSTLEGELSLFYRWGGAFGFAVFQPDLLGRGKGMVYFVGAGRDWRSEDGSLFLGTRLDVSFADAEHMMTEFGISAMDSQNSGLDTYRPGGGLKSSTAFENSLSKRWKLTGATCPPSWSLF